MTSEKKTLKKSLYAILGVLLCYSFMVLNGSVVRAEDEGIDVNILDPYIFHYMVEDYQNGDFETSGSGVTYTQLKEGSILSGLLIEGKQDNINKAQMVYKDNIEFSSGVTNKIRVDGLAKRGSKIFVEFYLDDAEEPFVSTQLKIQSDTDNWTTSGYKFIELNDPSLTGSHVLKIKLRVDAVADGKKTQALLKSFKFYKGGVPTVYVNIDESFGTIEDMNNSTNHTANCYGDITVKTPKGFKSEYMDEPFAEDTTQKCDLEYIRGRGNSTWMANKRPYKIKLQDPADFFGMGECKHWALIANYYDPTLLRNRMTYFLGNAMGMDYTPQLIPVDVVMNGTYLGSYYLSEVVRIDTSRVKIKDLEKIPETDTDITGGYLLGMSPYGDEEGYIFTTPHEVEFVLESPEEAKNGRIEDMNQYIEKYIVNLEKAIFAEDFKDPKGESYKKYLDLDSAAKYFLVQSFSMNGDAYGTASTKLYKTPGDDGKLYFGPLWDFDYVAWNYPNEGPNGGGTYPDEYDGYNSEATGSGYVGPHPVGYVDPNSDDEGSDDEEFDPSVIGFNHSFKWFDRLLEDPDFVEAVKEAWYGKYEGDPQAMRYRINQIAEDGGILDQYFEQLVNSAESNFDIPGNDSNGMGLPEEYQKNDDYDGYDGYDGDEEDVYIEEIIKYTNYDEYKAEIEKQKAWILERMRWVDKNINDIKPSTYSRYNTVEFYDGDELIYSEEVESYDYVQNFPKSPVKEGFAFGGWWGEYLTQDIDSGEYYTTYDKFTSSTPVMDKIRLEAKWIPADELIKTEEIFIGVQNIYLEEYTEYQLKYSIYPVEAAANEIDFSTSDPNVATVDSNGTISSGFEPGEAVITVTTADGKSASCKVHVVDPDYAIYADDMEFSEESVTLEEGKTKGIQISFLPEGAIWRDYRVFSSDSDVAEMTDAGLIIAKQAGKATIIVYIDDLDLMKKINVTVTGSSEEKTDTDQLNVNRLKKGTKFTSGKLVYVVTEECKMQDGKVIRGTVSVVGFKKSVKKKATSVVIPAVVTSKNNTFKVTGIKAKAFKGCKKLKKITIKTKTLKTVGKNAFKGINKKARIKVPAAKLKAYKKILKNKGQKKTVKITK